MKSYVSCLTGTEYRELAARDVALITTRKILRGAKPADLPVWQAVKVELVINLKTAKSLGLTMIE